MCTCILATFDIPVYHHPLFFTHPPPATPHPAAHAYIISATLDPTNVVKLFPLSVSTITGGSTSPFCSLVSVISRFWITFLLLLFFLLSERMQRVLPGFSPYPCAPCAGGSSTGVRHERERGEQARRDGTGTAVCEISGRRAYKFNGYYSDRKSTRLNSSHSGESRMPSSA